MTNYKDIKYQFPASATTSGTFADARISEASVTQHVTATDLQPIKSDISALALREATNAASAAFNLPNQFIETFTDDTNLGTQTDGDRTSGYWGTVGSTAETTVIDMSAQSGSLYTANANVLAGTHTNWTTECWARSTDITDHSGGAQGLFGQKVDHYGVNFQFSANDGGTDVAMWDIGAGSWSCSSESFTLSSASITSNTWHHVAFVKEGTTYEIYIDGTLRDGPHTCTVGNSGANYHIGRGQLSNMIFKGYVTEWRVSSVARYTSNFTRPTAPFANDSDTLVLMHSDTSNGSTTFTDSSSNGYTIALDGSAVDHTTDVASPLSTLTASATGTLIQSANTVASPNKTKVGGTMLYKDNAGTATLGTDLKIYFTANGGSNWTEAANYNAITPVYSTGIKQVRLGETTVTGGTDVRYKAVWANQASGSKETQLHGIGINY